MASDTEKTYDIILVGAGLAGLTLALELAGHPGFRGQRVLLLDRSAKQANDRTWCFWAGPDEPLPPVVYRSWEQCRFLAPGLDVDLDMSGYRYCMVRGLDFYRYAGERLAGQPGFDRIQAEVFGIEGTRVRTSAGDFEGKWILNSAFAPKNILPDLKGTGFEPPFSTQVGRMWAAGTLIFQHFKGWTVETEQAVFDPGKVTFMDFRIEQGGATRFVYVLPFSPHSALVEYTVFSPVLLEQAEYDAGLHDYLEHALQAGFYRVSETEFGVIPMTDYRFPVLWSDSVLQIGTAGGFVKASSGYAFLRTQRKFRRFVADWAEKGRPDPALLQSPWRFRLYDSILLKVLAQGRAPGADVFARLFRSLPATTVFRFLDEDTHFGEELRLMATQPLAPFFRTALEQMARYDKI